jgi:hypothetical protein
MALQLSAGSNEKVFNRSNKKDSITVFKFFVPATRWLTLEKKRGIKQ